MPSRTLVRGWFAVTAVVVLAALVIQIVAVARAEGRVANLLSYFTIDSNLLVLVTTATLTRGRAPSSTLFRVLWLDALAGIVVTGVVYQVALAGRYELHGLDLLADFLLHRVSPVLCVLGWLIAGPRISNWRAARWSIVFPLLWLAFTLARGASGGGYPYPFIDAGALGYVRVALNCGFIAVFFVLLVVAIRFVDQRLRHAPGGTRSADR
ncbi:Pr6Pr family membrane protein [Amycolatopsis ultiminotia]